MATRNTAVKQAADRLTEAQHVSREVGGRAAQRELTAARENLQQLVGQRTHR